MHFSPSSGNRSHALTGAFSIHRRRIRENAMPRTGIPAVSPPRLRILHHPPGHQQPSPTFRVFRAFRGSKSTRPTSHAQTQATFAPFARFVVKTHLQTDLPFDPFVRLVVPRTTPPAVSPPRLRILHHPPGHHQPSPTFRVFRAFRGSKSTRPTSHSFRSSDWWCPGRHLPRCHHRAYGSSSISQDITNPLQPSAYSVPSVVLKAPDRPPMPRPRQPSLPSPVSLSKPTPGPTSHSFHSSDGWCPFLPFPGPPPSNSVDFHAVILPCDAVKMDFHGATL